MSFRVEIVRFVSAAVAAVLGVAMLAGPARAADHATPSSSKHGVVRASTTPTPAFGGTPPMWVVHPYLVKDGKHFKVKAQVYADAFRWPSAKQKADRHLSASADKLVFSVFVAKSKYANASKPQSVNLLLPGALLAHVKQSKKVTERGVVNLSVTLDKDTSKKLASWSFKKRQAGMAIVVTHRKDTFTNQPNTPTWGMQQNNDAALQKKKAGDTERSQFLSIAKRQVNVDRQRVSVVPASQRSSWAGQSPMYNYVYVTNSTPFEQQVNFNPNVQCMWTGAAQQYPPAQKATVPPGGILQMTYVMEPNPFHGKAGTLWVGLQGATNGVNAPGTSTELTANLIEAATVTGENIKASLFNPELYNPPGVLAAVGDAMVTFLSAFLAGDKGEGTCSSQAGEYPEEFAVTSTVTGFGATGADTAWGSESDPVKYTAPNTWMVTQPIPAPTETQYWDNTGASDPDPAVLPSGSEACQGTTTSSGQSCYWTGATTVGSQTANTATSTCADPSLNAAPSNWCSFVYKTLQPMLGAQTSATYYWNGGQPAYMVSNNAPSGSFTGGSAAFQGGLFQNVGPNPGLPGDAYCWGFGAIGVSNCSFINSLNTGLLANYNPMGAMNIQLNYLTTPQYTSGMFTELAGGISGDPVPSVSVASGTNGGVPGINVTCDLSKVQPVLSLPFGPSNSATAQITGSQLVSAQLNAAGTTGTGAWSVNFFGVDEDGNYVYYNPNPGKVPIDQKNASSTSGSLYALGPNLTNATVAFNANGANQIANGFLPNTALGNLQTVKDMNTEGNEDIAVLKEVGCAAVPAATLSGLDITGDIPAVASNFGAISSNGNGWPMPGDHTGWPASLFVNSYGDYLNYSWQWPVDQVNVSFQGAPIRSTLSVSCTEESCAPTP